VRRRPFIGRAGSAIAALGLALGLAPAPAAQSSGGGLTAGDRVARAYDVVLDADFARMPAVVADTCGPAPPEVCTGLLTMSRWWELVLDPEHPGRDARFVTAVERAVKETAAWTVREPRRAEAWFYYGVALGARGQWRVLHEEKLAAAREGKRVKEALDRALALDPTLQDAEFGTGMYRYYAGIVPSFMRWLQWIFSLPGGDRVDGLARMERASRGGQLVGAEADYQLHLIYLWYEGRIPDALAKIRHLQQRYPHNPHFQDAEATIHRRYRGDHRSALQVGERLLAMAAQGAVHEAALAAPRARLIIAQAHEALGQRDAARPQLAAILADTRSAPVDVVRLARQMDRASRPRP